MTGKIGSVKRLSALLALLLLVPAPALAHATLVFGELSTEPAMPDPQAGFTLKLHMMDPVRTPIEDATVAVEFRQMSADEVARWEEAPDEPPPTPEQVEAGEVEVHLPEGDWHKYPIPETGPGGNYAVDVQLPAAGTYQVIMRDTTFPQEDAVSELILELGGAEFGEQRFIFPPTPIGTASLGTWLIWLVGLPLAAGVLVTVLSMRGGKDEKGSGKAKAS